jgi:hypothetical protein
MEAEDTSRPEASQPVPDETQRTDETDARAKPAHPEAGTASGARADDRNEEVEESPVPDPEDRDTDADDNPGAD